MISRPIAELFSIIVDLIVMTIMRSACAIYAVDARMTTRTSAIQITRISVYSISRVIAALFA